MTALVARELAVTPPGAPEPAVRGISLEVDRGEWVALSGPNGGGKTSLLLGLAGLWPISSGWLELNGRPFGPQAEADLRRRVAALLQEPSSQILQSTVAAELAFAGRNLGLPSGALGDRIRLLSAELGLERDLDRDPTTLSAGRQQLMLLAAALVAGPEVLLADEPTAHLDGEGRRRAWAALDWERQAGLAVVWATQDPDELGAADRVVAVGPPVTATLPAPPSFERAPSTALMLRVAAAVTDQGPRVATGKPLEIAVAGTGITALLGPNGVGKSVLLAAAAGLAPAAQIEAEWRSPPEPPPIVALQFPELQIFEERVADEIVYAAVTRGLNRQRALDLAARTLVGLGVRPERFMSARTWALAAGEKRLMEVVAALITPACLIVLDEPTAGLDQSRRSALARILVRLGAEIPVLVASQDLEWVRSLGAQIHQIGPDDGGAS